MSLRYFVLSACALAVTSICHAETASPSTLDSLTQVALSDGPQSAFHYTNQDVSLGFLPGLMLFARGAESDQVDFFSRGAQSGTAVTQDRVLFAPAAYSAPGLSLLSPINFQESVRFSPMGDLMLGGQGAFGALAYDTIGIRKENRWTDLDFSAGSDSQYFVNLDSGINTKDHGVLFAGRFNQADNAQSYRAGAGEDIKQADMLIKIDAASLPGARNPQNTQFTYQYTQDERGGSAIDLTQTDWEQTSRLAYSATAEDKSELSGHRFQLSHQVDTRSASHVYTDFYYHMYNKEMLQLSAMNDAAINSASLASVADFDRNPVGVEPTISLLGQDNDYESFGVQSKAVTQYGDNKVIYSARYHHDKAEISLYDRNMDWLVDRSLRFVDESTSTSFQDSATALTTAIETQMALGLARLDVGVAYENVNLTRELGSVSAADMNDVLLETDYSDDDWIPSIGIVFGENQWDLTINARKLWSAPSPGNLERESQSAWHYEIASHYQDGLLNAQISLYAQEFDNMHFNCTESIVCEGAQLVTQSNIEDVSVKGVEFAVGYQYSVGDILFPINWTYQYNQSEYQQTNCEIDSAVCAIKGQQLAWIPEQQLAFNTGMVIDDFSLFVNVLYQSERSMNLSASENRYMPSQVRVDFAANYRINAQHHVYFRVENALDEELVARETIGGISADTGQMFYFGYQWQM